jgi:hypothetical protein
MHPQKNTTVVRTIDVWIPWTVHDNSYTSAQKLIHSLLTVFTQKKEVDHEAH